MYVQYLRDSCFIHLLWLVILYEIRHKLRVDVYSVTVGNYFFHIIDTVQPR